MGKVNRYWTEDEIEILRSSWNSATRSEICSDLNRNWNSVRNQARRLGLVAKPPDPDPAQLLDHTYDDDSDWTNEAMLAHLRSQGYQLSKSGREGSYEDRVKVDLSLDRFEGRRFKIGIVSDTHLCSRVQQLSALNSAYDLFHREGVNLVLHAGDWIDGEKMYRGHEYGVFALGADNQGDYLFSNYPSRPGIETIGVTGNHDQCYLKRSGVNVVKRVCDHRDDLTWAGDSSGYVELPGGLIAYLHHGRGGGAYALSYKLQKRVRQGFRKGKPHIYILGHYHVHCALPDYHQTLCMLPGAFQGETPFTREIGVEPAIGCWMLEYGVEDESGQVLLTDTSMRWLRFPEVSGDYDPPVTSAL